MDDQATCTGGYMDDQVTCTCGYKDDQVTCTGGYMDDHGTKTIYHKAVNSPIMNCSEMSASMVGCLGMLCMFGCVEVNRPVTAAV